MVHSVIPAKAGIQTESSDICAADVDSPFRGDDGVVLGMTRWVRRRNAR
jgi:hypothetical protein